MGLSLVTAPTAEPVSIAEAKQYLRVTSTIEDDRIADLIASAREDLDGNAGWLGRAIMPQTWDFTLDHLPPRHLTPMYQTRRSALAIEIPLPPLQSVTAVTYLDQDAATQTLSTEVYAAVTKTEPGEIVLLQGQSWPLTAQQPDAVTIRFVAGYTKVPQKIRNIIFSIVAWRFENREGGDLPQSIMDQCSSLKMRFVS